MIPDPLFDFREKLVVITGGSRGLGRRMALAFAERGADLVIASRKLAACEETARECRKAGSKAMAYAMHAGRWSECDALLNAVYSRFGRLDVLINNAGMSPASPSHAVEEALFDTILNLNFKGPFRLASRAAWRMSQAEGGCIINVSSSGALMPVPQVVPYSAAKAALNAMSLSLAAEYAPKVRVNTISPGPFLTDIAKAWPPQMRTSAPNAAGRPGVPEEIVTAALMLASPASSFTTGALVRVDGGLM